MSMAPENLAFALPEFIDASPCGFVAVQSDGQVDFINQTMLDWLGLCRSDVQGRRQLSDFLTRAGSIYMQTHLMPQLLLTGSFHEVAINLRDAHGQLRKTLLAGRSLGTKGMAVLVFSLSDDRARLDEEIARLREAAQTRLTWLKQVERIADIGAWSVDLETARVTWSDQVFAIHDMPVGPVPPLDVILASYPTLETAQGLEATIRHATETGEPFQTEVTLRTPVRDKRVLVRGDVEIERGRPYRIIGVIEDITAQSKATEDLWRAAHMDELSGLANRHWFHERLAEATREASDRGHAVTLVLLDLDHFKEVNDLHGHSAGDGVIRKIAERIGDALPPGAFAGRLGGDEFAAVIREGDAASEVFGHIEALLSTLQAGLTVDGKEFELGVTIGTARFPQDARTPEGLLRCADMALLYGKQRSKGTVVAFDERIGAASRDRWAAINRVRQAAATGRIRAHYQPRIRLATGTVCGFEALARIAEADGSFSGPSDWGAALDDPDCARLIDAHVLEAVIADWTRLSQTPACASEAPSGMVSLNCSEHSLRQPRFVDAFLARLTEHGLPTSAIEIEVLETVLVNDAGARLAEQLAQLRQAGVSVSLDDFGTGYASLMHLTRLPIDRIKLDRSFMLALDDHARNRAIVRAMVDLAHALGIQVLAEGIETEQARDFLLSIGCDDGQGYLYGVPARR